MNSEMMSAAEALGLEEYVPYARKHPDSQKGFVYGMRRKSKRDEIDEAQTYLHTGRVRTAVAALIAERDALAARVAELEEDAARYRHYRDNSTSLLCVRADRHGRLNNVRMVGRMLDEVTDAARAEARPDG